MSVNSLQLCRESFMSTDMITIVEADEKSVAMGSPATPLKKEPVIDMTRTVNTNYNCILV